MGFRIVAAILLCTLWLVPAQAHDPLLSGLRILADSGQTVVSVTTHQSELVKAEGKSGKLSDEELEAALRRRLRLRFAGQDFAPEGSTSLLRDDINDVVTWQTTVSGEQTNLEVLARLYPENPTSRFAVTVLKGGVPVQETLLDADHPSLTAPEPRDGFAVALRYLQEGVRHIFGGPDHLCFLAGLLLLGGTAGVLLRTVTAFTLAHSITLTLAATGVFTPSPRFIEPLIALSIIAIAVENLRALRNQVAGSDKPNSSSTQAPQPRQDRRPWYAFGFGLIHGFGFAGALAEVGLPKASLGVALASFNIGVELGQAALVLVAVPLLALLARRPTLNQRTVLVGSLAIAAAGGYWFVTRLIG